MGTSRGHCAARAARICAAATRAILTRVKVQRVAYLAASPPGRLSIAASGVRPQLSAAAEDAPAAVAAAVDEEDEELEGVVQHALIEAARLGDVDVAGEVGNLEPAALSPSLPSTGTPRCRRPVPSTDRFASRALVSVARHWRERCGSPGLRWAVRGAPRAPRRHQLWRAGVGVGQLDVRRTGCCACSLTLRSRVTPLTRPRPPPREPPLLHGSKGEEAGRRCAAGCPAPPRRGLRGLGRAAGGRPGAARRCPATAKNRRGPRGAHADAPWR